MYHNETGLKWIRTIDGGYLHICQGGTGRIEHVAKTADYDLNVNQSKARVESAKRVLVTTCVVSSERKKANPDEHIGLANRKIKWTCRLPKDYQFQSYHVQSISGSIARLCRVPQVHTMRARRCPPTLAQLKLDLLLSKNVFMDDSPHQKHCFPSPMKRSLRCVYQLPQATPAKSTSHHHRHSHDTQNASPTSITCVWRPEPSRIPGAHFPTYTFLSVRDTVFPRSHYSNDIATRVTRPRSENRPIHPCPSKVSRYDPSPVTREAREGALTNTRRFSERMPNGSTS
jgi:hypothetical protein